MARPAKLTRSKDSTVNLADIARLVGCTPASVSLVFNNSPLPSKKMRENVMKAAKELGYIPNRMAQSLQRGRTFTLGAVMPYCSDHNVASFLDAVTIEATEYGFETEIHFHRWSAVEEERILKNLAGSRVEGVILYNARDSYCDAESFQALRSLKIPIIGLSRNAHPEFDATIVLDRVPGGFSLGQHLAALGHRRVDYFEPAFNRDSQKGLESSVNALLASLTSGMNGKGEVRFFTTPVETLPRRSDIEARGFSSKLLYQNIDANIEEYLNKRTGATAVVVANTMVAMRLIGLMRKRGMECPRDLSVVPFSVEHLTELSPLPMTAVEYSTDLMARKAVSSILALKAGQSISKAIKVPTVLVTRESSSPPRQ